jgi:predicted glycosyltransferase
MLEEAVLDQLRTYDGRAAVLLGRPERNGSEKLTGKVEVISHVSGEELGSMLCGARATVCRGGYTTIMELVSLGVKAALIPTPGQTEQTYLCERMQRQGRFLVQRQDELDLSAAARSLRDMAKPTPVEDTTRLLREALVSAVRWTDGGHRS